MNRQRNHMTEQSAPSVSELINSLIADLRQFRTEVREAGLASASACDRIDASCVAMAITRMRARIMVTDALAKARAAGATSSVT